MFTLKHKYLKYKMNFSDQIQVFLSIRESLKGKAVDDWWLLERACTVTHIPSPCNGDINPQDVELRTHKPMLPTARLHSQVKYSSVSIYANTHFNMSTEPASIASMLLKIMEVLPCRTKIQPQKKPSTASSMYKCVWDQVTKETIWLKFREKRYRTESSLKHHKS